MALTWFKTLNHFIFVFHKVCPAMDNNDAGKKWFCVAGLVCYKVFVLIK